MIIISCVRSSARFLEEDYAKGFGLVSERKRYVFSQTAGSVRANRLCVRMNVSITRAKELLVIIGNGELLKRDPYWKSLLQFAIRNKL